MRRLAVLLCALVLNSCIVPAWYSPVVDHDLQCIGGECDLGTAASRGRL